MIQLILYSRPECHLCDDMKDVVYKVITELDEDAFHLSVTDISGTEDLETRYGERIPVLAIGQEDAFEVRVRPEALRTRLSRELKNRP